MTRRKGSIQKRGPDKWLVRVYVGIVNGKRKYISKTVRGSMIDAQRLLSQFVRDRDTESFVEPSKEPFGDFLEQRLKAMEGTVEQGLLLAYRARIESDMLPHIGSVPLGKLSPLHVKDLYATLAKGEPEHAARAISEADTILRRVLKSAAVHGKIRSNPMERVTSPELPPRAPIQPLTVEQTRKLLAWTQEHQPSFYALWTLMLTTGVRPGEALGLEWRSVDLVMGWLAVQSSLTRRVDGRWVMSQTPKRPSSRRKVFLTPTAHEVLCRHREKELRRGRKRRGPYDLVFTTQAGKPWSPPRVRKAWRAACRGAGVPQVRLHDARHTHAVQLLRHGVHPEIVAARLGHSTIQETLDTYETFMLCNRQQVRDRVDELLFG